MNWHAVTASDIQKIANAWEKNLSRLTVFFFTLKALLLCAVPLFRSSSSDLAADYNVPLCGQRCSAQRFLLSSMIFFFIIRHQNPNEKHHRHSAQNSRIKFYIQKSGFWGHFAVPLRILLQICYKLATNDWKGGLLHVSLSVCKSESVSLLHIKKHVDTRKSRLPFQVNGLMFGGALSTALEPNTSSRVTVLASSVKLKLSTTRSSKT